MFYSSCGNLYLFDCVPEETGEPPKKKPKVVKPKEEAELLQVLTAAAMAHVP